jgi:phosphoglycerate kinase
MIPTVRDVHVAGKRVLLRAGLDVPMKDGQVADDRRIAETIPTVRALLAAGASQVIIIAHAGRPEGKRVLEFSLRPVAERLQELLREEVLFLDDCVNAKIPPTASVVLLENLRFHAEEERNDALFARKLAVYGDVYVDDAFNTMHRTHASITGLPQLFQEKAMGLLVEKEVRNLDFSNPERPFVAILGAAKISNKIELVRALLEKVDKLLLGGGIVFTFLKAKGYETGRSLCEEEKVALAKELLEKYAAKIVLPEDIVISEEPEGADIFTVDADKIPPDMRGLDIGDESVEEFCGILDSAKTVFWNGPLGMFEVPPFDTATHRVAEHLAKLRIRVVIGGGDTAAAIDQLGLGEKFTHVSTGGGASLQVVAGQGLPGLTALSK